MSAIATTVMTQAIPMSSQDSFYNSLSSLGPYLPFIKYAICFSVIGAAGTMFLSSKRQYDDASAAVRKQLGAGRHLKGLDEDYAFLTSKKFVDASADVRACYLQQVTNEKAQAEQRLLQAQQACRGTPQRFGGDVDLSRDESMMQPPSGATAPPWPSSGGASREGGSSREGSGRLAQAAAGAPSPKPSGEGVPSDFDIISNGTAPHGGAPAAPSGHRPLSPTFTDLVESDSVAPPLSPRKVSQNFRELMAGAPQNEERVTQRNASELAALKLDALRQDQDRMRMCLVAVLVTFIAASLT